MKSKKVILDTNLWISLTGDSDLLDLKIIHNTQITAIKDFENQLKF